MAAALLDTALAWPAVERIVYRGDLVVDAREVGALGEVLAHQAVGVLVGPPLPGVVRQREVHARAKGRGDLGAAGEPLATVHGYRLARLPGEGRDLRGGRVGPRVGGGPAARQ